jgi:hypothetical protein
MAIVADDLAALMQQLAHENMEVFQKEVQLPVLPVGSEAFIGKEVKEQMKKVAENVRYRELKYSTSVG